MNLNEMKSRLADGFEDYQYGKDAAVLIPLIEDPVKGLCVLFEVRSGKLSYQPLEICFPGGKMEAGETARKTAIRETCEELLIKEDQIEVIAPVRQVIAPRGGTLWGTVGVLHDYQGTYSEAEVDSVFLVPVQWLLENEPLVKVVEMLTVPEEDFPFELIPNGKNYKWSARERALIFYQYEGHVFG